MGQKLTTIRIESGLLGGNTPVSVNGTVVDLPHDQDVHVTDAHLQALTNSNVKFTIVDGAAANAPKATGEAAGGFVASPEPIAPPASENPPPGPDPEPLLESQPKPRAEHKPAAKADDKAPAKDGATRKHSKAAAKKPAA